MIGDKVINEELDFHAHILMNVMHESLFVLKGSNTTPLVYGGYCLC